MEQIQDCSLLLKNLNRIEALNLTQLYGTAPEEAFTRLNRLATKILKAPISIFSLIGEKNQFFKSAEGFEITPENNEVPIDVSVCQYSLLGKPLSISNTIAHPHFSENPAVKALNIVGYLGVPLITKEGHPIGAVCVIDHKERHWTQEEVSILEEITSSFLSEVELRIALRKAEAEATLREEFISIASHELHSPLSVLKIQSQLMQSKFSKHEVTEDERNTFFNRINRQIERVNLMIDDMSDLSRLEKGEFSLRLQEMDISRMLEDSVEAFSEAFQGSGTRLKSNVEKGILGHWDIVRVEQVLTNLISNALKYAPGAQVDVALKKDGDFVLISVNDTGPGISASDQEKIFQKYQRLEGDKGVTGLGLGLYIARQIAEQHSGSLTLKSDLGRGSSFVFKLPLS